METSRRVFYELEKKCGRVKQRTNASLHEHCHCRLKHSGSSEDRRRVMPAFPNNVPVVKALAGCTLLAGTRRWDCAGIPEAEGISRGSPSLRPAHHHPGPSQLNPNPGKELPRQDEMIIVIIVIIIILINHHHHHHLHQRPAHHPARPAGGEDHLGPSTLPLPKEPDVSKDCIQQYFKVDKVVRYVCGKSSCTYVH